MENREKLLDSITLYADRDKIRNLFPTQRKRYEELYNNPIDIALFVDNFNCPEKEPEHLPKYKNVVIISKSSIPKLTKYMKCIYSYLYVYVLR